MEPGIRGSPFRPTCNIPPTPPVCDRGRDSPRCIICMSESGLCRLRSFFSGSPPRSLQAPKGHMGDSSPEGQIVYLSSGDADTPCDFQSHPPHTAVGIAICPNRWTVAACSLACPHRPPSPLSPLYLSPPPARVQRRLALRKPDAATVLHGLLWSIATLSTS